LSAGTISTIGQLALCALVGWRLMRLWRCIADTTLTAAWWWGWCAVAVAAAMCIVRWQAEAAGSLFAVGDYVTAVMGLTPLMAVLGARRPTNRVWTPFVMLPLIAVLNWPVFSVVLARGWWGDLALETPVVAGFALVTMMACGNYFGTRLTLVALAWGGMLCGLVFCYAANAPTWWPQPEWFRWIVGGVGIVGLLRLESVWSRIDSAADLFDRLWFDFLDRYGVVWARRLQDRLNAVGEQQQWPGRLELDGWRWQTAPSIEQQHQIEHACRWLLRRFVDPAWIDVRLESAAVEPTPLKIDS